MGQDGCSRAEADQPNALAGSKPLAFIGLADDTPGDEAGDQHEGDIGAFLRRHPDREALIVLTRLIEAGSDKPTFRIPAGSET